MKAVEFKEIMIDYLSGNLSEDKQQEFEQFLSENAQYQQEFAAKKAFWDTSEEVPEPTTAMDMKFYAMLTAEEKKVNKVSFINKVNFFFKGSSPKQLAYTFAILTVGFFIGNGFSSGNNLSNQNLIVAQEETNDVRSQLVLTLLEQPSENQRLQAVNEVNKMTSVTETVLKALFSTLNNDDNVNVRLSAIEALKKYTEIPLVREGLINSLIHQ
jgi:hypothetical protein